MKILRVIPLFLLAVTFLNAQTFEGTVRWTMKLDIADPGKRAQMEEAQRLRNDPATQKELKEMQERMNSPEMKKMMDANPAMKAQLENSLKSASSGGASGNMMPTGLTIKIKGADMVTIMEGGMADGMEVLHAKDKPPTRVNRIDKTYSKMPEVEGGGKPVVPKVTKTGETTKLLDHVCTKYIVEVTQQGTSVKQVFWTTTEIKDMDMKAMARQRMGQGGQAMFYEQIAGVPLRMEFASPEGTMIMEVVEIKRQKLNDSDFVIPSDFKEVKMPAVH